MQIRKAGFRAKCPPGLTALIVMSNCWKMSWVEEYEGDKAALTQIDADAIAGVDPDPERFAELKWSICLKRETLERNVLGVLDVEVPGLDSSEAIAKRIIPKGDTIGDLKISMARLDYFFNVRRDLRRIANMCDAVRTGRIKQEQASFELSEGSLSGRLYMKGTVAEEDPESLLAILRGLDLDQIRRCRVCDTLFWAQRKGSQACSVACRNVLNVRNFRKESGQSDSTRLERRRSNRQYKKKLTKGANLDATI